ncbi:unnamed protein product, partial [Rotaria magnacalcarata]
MQFNEIGDNGARYLAEALQINKTLKSIPLMRNKIGGKGAQYLIQALQHNQTIKSLELEN